MKSMEKTSATKILEDSGNVLKKTLDQKPSTFTASRRKTLRFVGVCFFCVV